MVRCHERRVGLRGILVSSLFFCAGGAKAHRAAYPDLSHRHAEFGGLGGKDLRGLASHAVISAVALSQTVIGKGIDNPTSVLLPHGVSPYSVAGLDVVSAKLTLRDHQRHQAVKPTYPTRA